MEEDLAPFLDLLPLLVDGRLERLQRRHRAGDSIISVETRDFLDEVGLAFDVYPERRDPGPPDALPALIDLETEVLQNA